MAKALKFNLICDGQPVKDLEGLRENFEIETILENFNTERLHKWLKSRGFEEEYARVCAIDAAEPYGQIKALCEIFNVEFDETAANRAAEAIEQQRQKAEREAKYAEGALEANEILNYKLKEFDGLIDEMANNGTDAELIKRNVNTMLADYFDIFRHCAAYVFDKLINSAPYAILRFMLYEKSRPYYVPVTDGFNGWDSGFSEKYKESGYPSLETIINRLENHSGNKFNLNMMYKRITYLVENKDKFNNKIAHCLKKYNGIMDGELINIVPTGTRCMYIKSDKIKKGVSNQSAKSGNFGSYSAFIKSLREILTTPTISVISSADDPELNDITLFDITNGLDIKTENSSGSTNYIYEAEVWYITE